VKAINTARNLSLALGGLAVLVSASASADAPYFMGLGYFPDGGPYSVAEAASDDGSTVVGWAQWGGLFSFRAYRWTREEGMVAFNNMTSKAFDVSADGSVVVGYNYPYYEAFRWTAETGMVLLGDLPGGEHHSDARGVSGDGSVVVGWSGSENATYTFEAFRWTAEEGMVGLGDLPGLDFFSEAFGISGDGRVIVGMSMSDNSHEAFRWSQQEGMVGLGYLPGGHQSSAQDVSADGSVIVGTSADSEHSHVAFIWDAEHGVRNLQELLVNEYGLDLTGWRLSWARGVSADGLTIVGSGYHPNGDGEAWIAYIPEPGSLMLLVVGIGAALRRWRP
jgi:probable HAF family extracellular repeat protein